MLKMGLKEIKMNTIEVGGLGDMVFEIGKTRVLIQPEGQAAFSDSSKYMVIWKQQTDGTWKVYADIWNLFEQVPR
jgi:ketosteroid isomerase-like protein